MERKFVEIGQLDYDYLALATSEAADSIRCFPMTYGAKGIAFYAVMDSILLLYGMTVGASYIEVYEVKGSGKSGKSDTPLWRSISNQEYEYVRGTSVRPHHEFILASKTPDGVRMSFSIRVFPLDKEVEECFKDFPNIVSMLFGRRKVASITFDAIQFLQAGKAGRKPNQLDSLPDKKLYRELAYRVRFVIESQGDHKRLSYFRSDGSSMPLLLLAQRTSVTRDVPGYGEMSYSYRYILAPQQFKALPKEARNALEAPLQEPYRCRLDTTFDSGSLTTHNRKTGIVGPRIVGEMNPQRLEGLKSLRKELKLEEGCFQVYVPIHVKGTVTFVVVFQLPIRQRLDAFSVYANFIPAFSANLRQSVFETALSQADTTKKFHEIVEQLCGEREKSSDGRLVRAEGVEAYDKIIERRRKILEDQD